MHLMTPITPTRTNRITELVDQSIVKSTIISSCSSVKPISTNEKKKSLVKIAIVQMYTNSQPNFLSSNKPDGPTFLVVSIYI